MSLLTDIRDAATDSKHSISDALRKGLILATLLRNDELKLWLKSELEGYPDYNKVPEYRIITASVYGNFVGEYGRQLRGQRVPTEMYPDTTRDVMTRLRLGRGVRELEALVNDEYTCLVIDASIFPPIIEGMQMQDAWHQFHRSSVMQILDCVRTRLLELTLDLGERFPDMKKSEDEISKVDRQAAASVVTLHIHGSQNVIAAGSDIAQNVTQQIREGDVQMLIERLIQAGVPEKDAKEVTTAIAADGKPANGKLGPRVAKWIGNITTKALEGTVAAAPAMILELVKKH